MVKAVRSGYSKVAATIAALLDSPEIGRLSPNSARHSGPA